MNIFSAWCSEHEGKPSLMERMTEDLMPPVVRKALDELKAETAEMHRLNVEQAHMLERLRVTTRQIMVLRDRLAKQARRECGITDSEFAEDAIR